MLHWPTVFDVLRRHWTALIGYELAVKLAGVVLVGPLALAATYRVLGLWGESALGNWELVEFLLSPLGATALIVGASLTLGIIFLEYAGLIVMADAGLRGRRFSILSVASDVLAASPRLLALAALMTCLSIVAAIPFLAAAGGVYWLLLSDADINYYVAQRPPKFWAAALMGALLAGGMIVASVWFLVRWALAVPACVLDGESWIGALRCSTRLMKGRAWRLLAIFGAWQLTGWIVAAGAIAALDFVNRLLATGFSGSLSLLLWSTVLLLLLDGVVLQILSAVLAIGTAALLACEYEAARPKDAGSCEPAPAKGPSSRFWKVAVLALEIFLPAAGVYSGLALAKEFVEHRSTRVTGHRAGSTLGPENSITALRRSMAVGADYVEIDVQQTADGKVVLMHDRDLRRTTGDARDVNETTLAEIRKLRLRDANGPTDEPPPTLAEFIAACDGRIRLNVEMKDFGRTPELGKAVAKVLRESKAIGQAVSSSFDMAPLRQLKQTESSVPIGMILSAVQGDAARLPVDFLSLHSRLVDGRLVRRAHQQGKEVHVWSVGDRETALRLLDLGCDNLIVSDPESMRTLVDWYAGLGDVERMLLRVRRWMRE